ncbi:MAG TPA: toll/interleukin-1 receptor domain-containing protein, partial [Kofleriaceae bacterium]
RLEREAGVRVWLDRDALRGGDQWERHIADTLRGCALCVPVISAEARSGGFRYLRAEWRQAVKLQAGRPADQTFLLPLVIDDTRPDDPAIDPELRALHWRRLDDEADMQRFLTEVRAAVEKSLS